MKRREFLKLGAVATGTFAVAGTLRVGGRAALAQSGAVPAVDRLVMTNVVDNVYDIFAKGGKLDTISVQRTPLERGGTLLAEHGLAYHLESLRGSERREVLLDFSLTERNLLNNYAVLKVDPSRADALILSHGHRDHYGALPDLARLAQGKLRPAGSEGERRVQGPRDRRRLSLGAGPGRDRREDRRGVQGDRPRLHHPDALHRVQHDRGRARRDAEEARDAVDGHARDLRRLARHPEEPCGRKPQPKEAGHGEGASVR